MKEKYFKNQYFEIWLDNGIVNVVYEPKLRITLEVAKQITEQRLKVLDVPRPVLIDVRHGTSIDKAARDFWGKEDSSLRHVTAGAILVKNQMQKLVAMAFIALNKEPVPTKIFVSEKKALEWLEHYKYERLN